ncbi:MAG TPA: hypothetical protein VGY53_08180 [Isosphaeraceae bacterium]|jgi:hypothetical protein|nr:hypothetical protein [Isosphaeraceae bacterium]
MGNLKKLLGKFLSGGESTAAHTPAEDASGPAQGGAEPAQADPATAESQSEVKDSEPALEHPEQALSPITDIHYISASESSEAGVEGGSGQDRLVMVYKGQDLTFDVTDDMKHLSATDFVPRLIEQAYEKYEILFDTDDIFQVMMLLRKARPAEQG